MQTKRQRQMSALERRIKERNTWEAELNYCQENNKEYTRDSGKKDLPILLLSDLEKKIKKCKEDIENLKNKINLTQDEKETLINKLL